MSELNDAKLAFLEAATANTGSVQDLEQEYLQSVITGAISNNEIHDLWNQYWDELAIPAGAFNDRALAFLKNQGGTEDGYNEAWLEFWLGTPAPSPPPTIAGLQFHWDFNDLGQMFQDLAGTIPVTSQGDPIRRLNNKGSAPDHIQSPGAIPPTYEPRPSILGRGAANFTGNIMFVTPSVSVASGVNGMTFGGVIRRRDAPFPTLNTVFRWGAGIAETEITLEGTVPGPNDITLQASGVGKDIKVRHLRDNWYWVIGRFNVGGLGFFTGASTSQQAIATVYNQIPALDPMLMGGGAGNLDIAEILVWDDLLTQPEQDAVVAYWTAKYGQLPTTPQLPCYNNLQHFFDFSFTLNNLWQDVAGTVPVALDGDPIRNVTNLGSDGTALTEAVAFPTHRVNVLNALPIARFLGAEQLTALIAAAQNQGNSHASLARHNAPLPSISNASVMDWGDGVIRLNGTTLRVPPTNFGDATMNSIPIPTSAATAYLANTWYGIAGAVSAVGGPFFPASSQRSALTLQAGVSAGSPALGGDSLAIGARGPGGSLFWDGDIAEVAFWDIELPAADIQLVLDYYDRKYGTLPQ